MKYFIYILIAAALGLLVFNITNVNLEAPFQGDSTIALICTAAAACVILLLIILLVSRKISGLAKR
ncbi:hypothetical protein [Patiriisocius marinus]|uniref:Uncharacterized protein n=1 Tax=Patiriisocius marinus TaxID=1397112 RepID=A0A5J4IVU7_9FLAO|nr:hypothetical protein [Patiriisocius marinus]GER58412.1 hypothetical protein ULMA_05200 [Patiriisocius marinus]